MHWATTYIGLPWKADGDGPDSFHCWAFVRFVQERQFGRSLPEIPNPRDLRILAHAFRDHPERRRWELVDAPREGDCVLLRQARYAIHVGIWIEDEPHPQKGGVLHCIEGSGVVFQRLDALTRHGWHIEGFYRFQGL